MWLGGEDEDVISELGVVSERFGDGCGRSGSERGGDGVRWLRARETEEGRRSRERGEVRGDPGGSCGDVQDVGDADRQAGGGEHALSVLLAGA